MRAACLRHRRRAYLGYAPFTHNLWPSSWSLPRVIVPLGRYLLLEATAPGLLPSLPTTRVNFWTSCATYIYHATTCNKECNETVCFLEPPVCGTSTRAPHRMVTATGCRRHAPDSVSSFKPIFVCYSTFSFLLWFSTCSYFFNFLIKISIPQEVGYCTKSHELFFFIFHYYKNNQRIVFRKKERKTTKQWHREREENADKEKQRQTVRDREMCSNSII